LAEILDDVLQVAKETGSLSILVTHQSVAFAQELEYRRQFFPPVGAVPFTFSARITSQPAAFNAGFWIDKS
jgi:hypothetical protein